MSDSAEKTPKKKLPLWGKIVIGVVCALLVLSGVVYGIFNYYYHQMNIDRGEEVQAQEEYFDTDENIEDLKELDPDTIQLDSADSVNQSKEVINILICG